MPTVFELGPKSVLEFADVFFHGGVRPCRCPENDLLTEILKNLFLLTQDDIR